MAKKSDRINFSQTTIRKVEKMAGGLCSYPACGRRTSSKGATSEELANTGTAAHIYSAAENGPRGRGGLSKAELKSPNNAVWMCREHGTLIDTNRGKKFPPELLISFKQLHEARVAREHQGLYSPVAWLNQIRISKSPVFQPNSSATLAKLNLIVGDNASGKTALCEWIAGCFDVSALERWSDPPRDLDISLDWFIPQELSVGLRLTQDKEIQFRVNRLAAPVNPYSVNLIRPVTDVRRINWRQEDDLQFLADVLRLSPSSVRLLFSEIESFKYSKCRNLSLEEDGSERALYLDLEGTAPGLCFGALSGREQETVIVEFATALARYCSKHAPTLLILDGTIVPFKGWFDEFSHHFLDPENQFQTILTIPTQKINVENIEWNGWKLIRTSGRITGCEIHDG